MNLRTKLLLFNLLIVGVLTLLASILIYDFKRLANLPARERNLKQRVISNVRQLARNSEAALAADDRTQLEQLATAYRTDEDLAFVSIWDQNDRQIGKLGRTLSLGQLKPLAENKIHHHKDDLLVAWSAVQIEGLQLGVVAMGCSLERLRSARTRLLVFWVLVVVVAIFAALASLYFSSHLTRPMLRITSAFKRMAKGDLVQQEVRVERQDETGEMARAFNAMLSTLRRLGDTATQVARGNLDPQVKGEGDLIMAFQKMIVSQREMVKQITETAVQIMSSVNEFQANAEQQERGAVEQSTAVEENRRTMDTLLDSSRQVSETAQGVLENAEKTQENINLMAERIAALSAHTQRITEILQVIKEIANKSDLLALNAALEGTRAGEAGRGFSLVATQIQRLAENVMVAVQDIKELTRTITEATRATVLATEDSTKLSTDTTRSARQIAVIVQQQQSGTEQMSKAMDDVALVAHDTAMGSKQIVASTHDLSLLASRLQDLVGGYTVSRPEDEEG